MPNFTISRAIAGLLVAASLIQLQGCSSEPQAPSAAPEPAATDQPPAEARAQALSADELRPGECAPSGTVALPATSIGGANLLHRSGEPHMLPIVSLKADSRAWQTDCPVPLQFGPLQPSEGCHVEALLPRPARLSLKHIAGSDNYALTIEPMPGHEGKTIQRTLTPAMAPPDHREHVTWLVGKSDAEFAAELYVHLRDTRSGNIRNAHKNYVVEVFASGALNCDVHRPHLTTCRSDDFPDRAPCDGGMTRLGEGEFGIKQTDTGTGNEPPAV